MIKAVRILTAAAIVASLAGTAAFAQSTGAMTSGSMTAMKKDDHMASGAITAKKDKMASGAMAPKKKAMKKEDHMKSGAMSSGSMSSGAMTSGSMSSAPKS